MRILVNGLPFFSRKLVKDLNTFDKENSYVFYNTYYSKWEQIRYLLALPFAGAVLSSNGVSDKSKSLDLALFFRKKLIMQWHGTDVQLAVERQKKNTIYRKYIDVAQHLVSAAWFVDELKDVISPVAYVPFGYVEAEGNSKAYEHVSVLTYLAKGREQFYGWDLIVKLALEKPDLRITVVGSDGIGFDYPENIVCTGWVDEVKLMKLMQTHSIFIRLTEHDGKSISVSQALGVGCEVIWTYKMEMCHHVSLNPDEIIRKVHEVKMLVESRNLMPNQDNISYAKRELNRDAVMRNFVVELKKLLND